MSTIIIAIKKMLGLNKVVIKPLPAKQVDQDFIEYFHHDRDLFIQAIPHNPTLDNMALLKWLLFNGELSNISSYSYSTLFIQNNGITLKIMGFKQCPETNKMHDFSLFSLNKVTQKIDCLV